MYLICDDLFQKSNDSFLLVLPGYLLIKLFPSDLTSFGATDFSHNLLDLLGGQIKVQMVWYSEQVSDC